MVDAEPPQRGVEGARAGARGRRSSSRVPRRPATTPALVASTTSSRAHDVAEQRADQLLGGAVAVAGRGVQQRAAGLDERFSWSRASCSSVSRPQVIVPSPEAGDLEPGAAEVPLLHGAHGSRRERPGSHRLAGASPGRRLSAATGRPERTQARAALHGLLRRDRARASSRGSPSSCPSPARGHLTIAEKLLGLQIDDPAVTAFTAVIQMGASPPSSSTSGATSGGSPRPGAAAWSTPEHRGELDHRMGWYVIVGSHPDRRSSASSAKDLITGPLRSLWVVAAALIVLERRDAVRRAGRPRQSRGEKQLTMRDAIVIGLRAVARPGAGRLPVRRDHLGRAAAGPGPGGRDPDGFFLAIPALTAAGLYELQDALDGSIPVGPTVVGDRRGLRGRVRLDRVAAEVRRPPLIASSCPTASALGTLILVLLSAGVMSPT